MNNLKIINDRYGHEEGLFLHTIAEILAEIVQKEQTGDGVVARIGGDEYACALMTEKKKELLLQELYDAFTVRNEQSDKPYNVTVSIGACALEPGDEHSLADALSLADEQLYEVKKLRKKMSQKYRCRQSLSGKKTFLTVFCFRTYSDLPAFEGHPDSYLSVDQRQHIHRQSADGCFGRRRCKRPPLFADRRSDG